MPGPYLLDRLSRLRLRNFAFKLLIPLPVLVALTSQRNFPLLGALSSFCLWNSVFVGTAGVFQHHKLDSAFLTAWDEMAAFLGLAVLMHLVDAVIQ